MLRGSSPTKIDDKGRLKIPTDFRRLLEDQWGPDLFVTSVQGDRVLLYPLSVWEGVEARLVARPSTDPLRNQFLQRVNYFGQQVRFDQQGRILIPQLLRERAAMNGDVVVSGLLDHLEVWNHERLLARLEEEPFTDDHFRALAEQGI